MNHKYNIPGLLLSLIGYKGLPYPGGFFPKRPGGEFVGGEYSPDTTATSRQELINGTRLYKQDAIGQWYFMPVFIKHPGLPGGKIELPHAVVSIKGSKSIVETPMVSRAGSVKELISIDDYKVSLAAFVCSEDGSYPHAEITQMRELFSINESVTLVSVVSDLILDAGRKVVITSVDFPASPGIEDGQVITLECVTDQEFELTIV